MGTSGLPVATASTIETEVSPTPQIIAFETIERADAGITYHTGKNPKIILVGAAEEVDAFGGTLSTYAVSELKSLNYNQFLGVVVFQGIKPSSEYGVDIQFIGYSEGIVYVYANFILPDPEKEVENEETSPYQVIKIPKPKPTTKILEAVLVVDGKAVARQR